MLSMEHATSTTPANEIWRPIRDFEGLYEVSSLGQVRSVDRTVRGANAMSDSYPINRKGRVLKQSMATNGYLFVVLCKDGKHTHTNVHRLVAETFIPNPDILPEVNHKDEDKTNNAVSNLEWCDRKYNVNYGTGIDRRSPRFFKRLEQLTMDGQHVAYYESVAELVRQSNGKYKANNIYMAARGDNESSYGYRWRYVEHT